MMIYTSLFTNTALKLLLLFRTLIHELLKKLDSYLWSQRSGSLAPKVSEKGSSFKALRFLEMFSCCVQRTYLMMLFVMFLLSLFSPLS